MRDKMFCVRKLLGSNAFVLVTDTDAMMFIDVENFSTVEQLHYMKQIAKNLDESIKGIEQQFKSRGRKTSKKREE